MVELPLRAGIERRIVVDSDAWWIRLRVTAADDADAVLFQDHVWRADATVPFEKELALAPGEYAVAISDESGRSTHERFAVEEDSAATAVELTLR